MYWPAPRVGYVISFPAPPRPGGAVGALAGCGHAGGAPHPVRSGGSPDTEARRRHPQPCWQRAGAETPGLAADERFGLRRQQEELCRRALRAPVAVRLAGSAPAGCPLLALPP